MSDQVLSQEEINALLSAMNKGEVDLAPEGKGDAVIEEYRLASQNKIPDSQFDALEQVHDRFAELLDQLLSSTVQGPLEVESESLGAVKYGEYISGFSNPTSLSIFSMEPLIGSAMMVIEPKLVFSLIDCMFGGEGKPLEQIREFTLIEQRMIKKFSENVLEKLEEAWSKIHNVNISLKKTETKPEFAHPVNPDEQMMIKEFRIKGPEFVGSIHLCLSYLMLEPIKEKLNSTFQQNDGAENAWSHQIQDLLRETPINIIAELGNTIHTIGEILNLKVDDVLHLGTGPEDHVTLTVDGIPKYKGYPGIVKGNRAVEVTKLIS